MLGPNNMVMKGQREFESLEEQLIQKCSAPQEVRLDLHAHDLKSTKRKTQDQHRLCSAVTVR